MEQQLIDAVLTSGELDSYNKKRLNLVKKGDFERLRELQAEYLNDNTKRDIERVRNLLKRRRNRVAKRINEMVFKYQCDCYFITLTFRDSVFNSTSKETRRKYVQDFLNSVCGSYVANIDFGDDHFYIDQKGELRQATEREHYHAVVNCRVDLNAWYEKFGAFNCRKISVKNHGVEKMSEYILKLTNHALKMSALTEKPIFSRGGGVEAPRSLWVPKEQIHNEYLHIQQVLKAKIRTNYACPFRVLKRVKYNIELQKCFDYWEELKKKS